MHPSVVNPWLLTLGVTALVGAAYLNIKNAHLKTNLNSVEAARITDTQATSEQADQSENANIETEHLLEKVREELIEAHRAKDAAELTLKQVRDQLAMEKGTIDMIEERKKVPARAETPDVGTLDGNTARELSSGTRNSSPS